MNARILFTNGSQTLQLYWIRHTGSDVYHGSIGTKRKHSYHKSGQVHFRDADGEFMDKRMHVPLSELRSFFILGNLVFKNSSSWFEGDTLNHYRFRGSKADALLTLDSRALPKSSFVILTVGLLEPGKLESIEPIVGLWRSLQVNGSTRQLLIESSIKPWVWANVIALSDEDIGPGERVFLGAIVEAAQNAFGPQLDNVAWHVGPIWHSNDNPFNLSDIDVMADGYETE